MDNHPKQTKERLSPVQEICKWYTEDQIRELIEVFNSHLHDDIQIWTSEALMKALKTEGYNTPDTANRTIDQTYIQGLFQKPEELEAILLYCYNRNFWNTHIKDWNNLKDLRLYKPWDVYQEWMDIGKWRNFWALEKYVSKYWRGINRFFKETFWVGIQDAIDRHYQPHLIEMSPEEEWMIEEILWWLRKGEKSFIILNHDTFANIPLAILKFMKKAEECWMEPMNKYFTTVIGPLLNVHRSQNMTINSLSNVVTTHPAWNKIPEAKPIISLQQKWALNQFIQDLGPWGEGQVYFCAPSWTRDVVMYRKDEHWETVPKIFLPDETWGSNVTTVKMLNKLKKANPKLHIYAMATNTTDLKKGISPTDNSWNKWADITTHFYDLNQWWPLETKDVVKRLAEWVCYPVRWKEDWEILGERICGTLVPADVFRKLKEWSKTWRFPEGILMDNWEIDFNHLNELIQNWE